MVQYQLQVGIALGVSSVVSLGRLLWHGSREDGKIKLPASSLLGEDESAYGVQKDPFDVTVPEDFVDGIPIDERQFWLKMRWRKIAMSMLLAAAVIVQAVSLGWSSIDSFDSMTFASQLLALQLSVYLLVITTRAVGQDLQAIHSESILHLTGLSLIATFLFTLASILPNAPPPLSQPSSEFLMVMMAQSASEEPLWYTALALYAVVTVLAFSTPLGPPLYFPPDAIYSGKVVQSITNRDKENVSGDVGASPWSALLFSYTTKVVMLGNYSESLEIGDLPIVPAGIRATFNYTSMKSALRTLRLKIFSWEPKPASGWNLIYLILRLNWVAITASQVLAAVTALLYYVPPWFLNQLVSYLEADPERKDRRWGWVYVLAMFASSASVYILTNQMWSLCTTTIQVRIRVQMNTVLFQKTLVRKDVASSAASKPDEEESGDKKKKDEEDDDFSSKAQIMTLMTTDVDRVSEFGYHLFTFVDSPIELVVGSIFLYNLLGVSCFFGLAVTALFMPLNHWAGKVVVAAQDNLMKARDERIALMNEILGAIRMLKFMAWERSFEAKVLKIREKELRYQKLNYTIEVLWNAIWNGSPILVTLVAFWHFTVIRGEDLTPSIAFTSIIVFTELKFALNALPETLINMLQSLVSVRRIEKYLSAQEVSPVPPMDQQSQTIAFQSCTLTWPQDRSSGSRSSSVASTPRQKFSLIDLTLQFPPKELSLICGKLGSGKTLLLYSLLGEVDILSGQMMCPRSPPDSLASFANMVSKEDWIVQGICAYVPQAAWLRNASIKDNILFNLPFDEERYRKTLEVCALVADLEILEDGDEAEIGERGVNLSGGQKARVSLARAVYSRASILLLDDVLSAVDAHTAHHLYNECLKGELMKERTVILVSHHVQLCAPGAKYIVALENGRAVFDGNYEQFQSSPVHRSLVVSSDHNEEEEIKDAKEEKAIEETKLELDDPSEEGSSTAAPSTAGGTTVIEAAKQDKKPARKLVDEEKRAVGRISRDVWLTYLKACGASWYWLAFIFVFIVAALSPVLENGWLKTWAAQALERENDPHDAKFYISIYALVCAGGLVVTTLRWFVLYSGSIHASTVLYKRLLETVLFANLRFHDTVSRGRLLNRFGKDFEGLDSNLSDHFGRSTMYGLSALTTLVTISYIGGLPFILAMVVLMFFYWQAASIYGQTSRDMRRLDSVTRSPLYSMYGETIAGVTIIRSFGASSKFLRDMFRCVDTNTNPFYWMWGVNRWLSVRFNVLSSAIIGITGFVAVLNPNISASMAGFMLAFANTITSDLLFMVRRFVGLEQAMVALERVKEYSDLQRESPEFIEPRPDPSWPSAGAITCENLVIKYAPELPAVLHHLNFEVKPGEKIGVLGRTGSGKSTLALSFFRFVEATEGRILVDGLDISKIGLTDLRSKLTIIPQDPTILSGTLRSTLDVFDEYQDADIYEALRRVHLIPASSSEPGTPQAEETENANVFKNLDSPVSEGGDNFSTGEKQLICMARAILKRSRVLVMDEATASVDYATDELIGKTIRHEFAESTILTIAHRLRTVIDYDRILLLENGKIVEYDRPATLLKNPESGFYSLCKASGKEEFSTLKRMAGV